MSAIVTQFVGLGISSAQLGIAVAQGFCYCRTFPRDNRLLKYLVVIILILTTSSTVLSCIMYWSFFNNCFRSSSPECLLWETTAMLLLLLNASTPFIVQSFYCHRLWIISNGNIYIITPLILLAASSFGLGLSSIPPQTHGAFVSTTPLSRSVVRGVLNAICDCMISVSVYFYLRPSRSGVKRMDNRIQSVTYYFVGMGILSSLMAILLCFLYWANQGAAIGGAAMLLRNSYANSLLAILNARQPIRPGRTNIELPTDIELSTIRMHTSK